MKRYVILNIFTSCLAVFVSVVLLTLYSLPSSMNFFLLRI